MDNENLEETKDRNILHEDFIFSDEIFRLFEEERNKCLRSILWTAEVIIPDKKSDNFMKLRKSVLDSVNDFYRKVFALSKKVI
jgi:hypothetical protein